MLEHCTSSAYPAPRHALRRRFQFQALLAPVALLALAAPAAATDYTATVNGTNPAKQLTDADTIVVTTRGINLAKDTSLVVNHVTDGTGLVITGTNITNDLIYVINQTGSGVTVLDLGSNAKLNATTSNTAGANFGVYVGMVNATFRADNLTVTLNNLKWGIQLQNTTTALTGLTTLDMTCSAANCIGIVANSSVSRVTIEDLALTLDGAGGDTIRNTTGFSITNGAQIAISGNTVMTLTGSAVQGVYAWSTKLRDAVPSQITFTTADITITGTGASNTATAFVAEYGANIIISDSAKITVTGDTAMGVKAAATNSDYYPTGVVLNNTVMTVTGDTVGVGIYGYGGSSTNSAVVTANNSSITSSHVGIRHTNGLLTVNLTGTTMVSNGDVAFEVTDGTLPKLPAKLIVNADNSTFNGVSNYTVTDADSDPATTSFFNLNMSNNSTWTIPGDSRLTNLALNDSTLRFSARNDGMFTTLTLDGDFSGTGGTIYLNTKLDDDASPTDLIHIKGNSSGAATLHVANAGGSGALTSGDGIKVVDVEGTSGAVLTLAGDYQTDDGKEAVVAGAYGYTLEQGGVADANDGDWYLRSRAAPKPPDNGGNNDNNNGGATHTGGVTPAPAPATPAAPVAPALRYQPFVPMAEAYATVLSEGIMNMESFHQRIGGRFIVNSGATAVTGSILPSNASGYAPVAVSADLPGLQPVAAPTDDEGRPLFMWADVRGSRATFKPDKSTTGVASTANDWQIRSGFDAMLYDKDENHLLAGLNVFYGGASVDAKSVHGNGSLDIRRYGLGATMTWFNDSGTYVDLHGRAVWFDTDIKADALGPLANKAKAFGWAASAEVGHTFRITPSFSLTPQAQLIYGTVNFKDITDRFNNRYEFDDNTSLRGRVGVEAAYTTSRFNAAGEYSETRLYSTLNLYHEFSNKRKLKVANVAVGNERERNWGGLALGVSHTWKNGRFRIFGEVEAMSSINGRRSHAVTGRIGFAVRF